jgi:plasmid maintenance system killer protein
MIDEKDGFIHKGLQRLWDSGGTDHSGIQFSYKKNVTVGLAHLSAARSIKDVQAGWGVLKKAKLLSGHTDRYSMEVNANDRLTFTCDASGMVSKIDLEDTHGPGGAKRH